MRRPLQRLHEQWIPQALDRSALDLAAAELVGTHDFAAFAAGPGGVRTVRRAEWTRPDDGVLRFGIEADAFLRGMVRAIVGTLLWVGRGKIPAERFADIIGSRDRAQAGPSAPPGGLCLVGVRYEAGITPRAREDEEGAGDEE